MSPFNPRQRNTPGGQITIALYRITQAIEALLRERGKDMHLSPTQIETLLFLKYARPGVRTIGGLAHRLHATYATASGVADALERKRLIQRAPSPADQRVITIELTAQGDRETRALEPILDELEAAVNALPEAEQAVLRRAAERIVRRLQQAGYVRVYEMCWRCQFFRRDAHPQDPRGPHHCAFMDAPLAEPNTYLECPDFVPTANEQGGDVMPLSLTLYGATDCDDTERTRSHLRALGIPFHEVNIDHDPAAEQFVTFINRGNRSTPTLVLGDGKTKMIVTEPTDDELDQMLTQAGYSLVNKPTEGDVEMSATTIAGYTYGTAQVSPSPLTTQDLENLKQAVLFGPEDEKYLRLAGEVLADQIEDVLDVWYGFVGSHPHLVYYFTDGRGNANGEYLAAVRKRFGQWILDTCNRPYDQAWLNYAYEIGLRHHHTKKNKTDGVQAVPHVHHRYLVAFIYPITATIKPFLARKGHSPEEVEKMHQAWFKSVVMQVALWSAPYVKEGDF